MRFSLYPIVRARATANRDASLILALSPKNSINAQIMVSFLRYRSVFPRTPFQAFYHCLEQDAQADHDSEIAYAAFRCLCLHIVLPAARINGFCSNFSPENLDINFPFLPVSIP